MPHAQVHQGHALVRRMHEPHTSHGEGRVLRGSQAEHKVPHTDTTGTGRAARGRLQVAVAGGTRSGCMQRAEAHAAPCMQRDAEVTLVPPPQRCLRSQM